MKYARILLTGVVGLPLALFANQKSGDTSGSVSMAETAWGGYSVDESGWVDTVNWFGRLNATHSPWMYSTVFSGWLWAWDPGAAAPGAWAYVVNDDGAAQPVSWEDAWASGDQGVIDTWYEANTGPGALGVSMEDMWETGRLEVTQAWLTANEGEHVFREGDRWIVYAVKAPSIHLMTDNVTVRACFLELTGTVFGFSGSGKDCVIEYCEVTSDGTSPQSMKGMSNITDITVRYNEAYGLPHTVWRLSHNSMAEYNYVHSGVLGIKHVSISVRGNNTYVRRNNLQTNSGSMPLGIYSHDALAPETGLENVLIEENIINGRESHYGMMGGGEWNSKTQQARTIVVVNNVFGSKFNPCCGTTGSNYLWLGRAAAGEIEDDRGNIWSGNRWLTTGNYIRPVTGHGETCPDDSYDDPGVGGSGDANHETVSELRAMFAPYLER